MRVSPFGNLRIEAHLQLPVAFRSLSRPSSAPDAKAFPLCSFLLQLLSCVSLHSWLHFWLHELRKSVFLLNCSAPLLIRKNLPILSQIFYLSLLSVFTLPWELFFLIFVCSICFSPIWFSMYTAFRLGGLKWIRTTDLALIRRTL